jgi:hypothetical protein
MLYSPFVGEEVDVDEEVMLEVFLKQEGIKTDSLSRLAKCKTIL